MDGVGLTRKVKLTLPNCNMLSTAKWEDMATHTSNGSRSIIITKSARVHSYLGGLGTKVTTPRNGN